MINQVNPYYRSANEHSASMNYLKNRFLVIKNASKTPERKHASVLIGLATVGLVYRLAITTFCALGCLFTLGQAKKLKDYTFESEFRGRFHIKSLAYGILGIVSPSAAKKRFNRYHEMCSSSVDHRALLEERRGSSSTDQIRPVSRSESAENEAHRDPRRRFQVEEQPGRLDSTKILPTVPSDSNQRGAIASAVIDRTNELLRQQRLRNAAQ